ncbi:MAG: uroporphyrinogen decarboxylase [Bacteroidota bacterium]
MSLKNDLLLRTIRKEKTERTPVWLMRQAGRILPEYRAIRNSLSGFKELVETPELAAEVTIQPVDILEVDAAIIFSDILVIPEAMGLSYQMVEKKGPRFLETVEAKADLARLNVAEADDVSYTIRAIEITRKELNHRVPIIGFAGAPWTIFAYMVEGSGSKTFSKARALLYGDPTLAHTLLQMITTSTINYLRGQIMAGADLVQVFDSWAGILSPRQYEEFSLPYISQICDAIQEVPKTVFAKDAYFARSSWNRVDCQTVGLDWCMDIKESRELMPDKVLQGNFDPCALYGNEEEIMNHVKAMLKDFGPFSHIANLGHGVYPDTDPEKVKFFIKTVKAMSLDFRDSF